MPLPPLCWSLSTKRIRLVVAYDGTNYRGWAAQPGLRTVQSTLTEAVRQVSGEENEITGASRTDSGAHAKGQVCHFDTANPMPAERWAAVLNKRLAGDIAVQESKQVADDFSSRFWARDRFYRYRIQTSPRDPHRSRFVHGYGRELNPARMQEAAASLVGRHDFRKFGEELEGIENTVRVLFSVDVLERRDEIWIDIVGTAFIRGMMRRISGALLEVGRGMREPSDIARLLQGDPEVALSEVLPARGLTLMRIRYGRRAWPGENEFE